VVARRRPKRAKQTEYERVKAMLDALPPSDEDPALYWGPNWKEELERDRAEYEAGPKRVYYTLDEFIASLTNDDEPSK
jgi:hypothetical protein